MSCPGLSRGESVVSWNVFALGRVGNGAEPVLGRAGERGGLSPLANQAVVCTVEPNRFNAFIHARRKNLSSLKMGVTCPVQCIADGVLLKWSANGRRWRASPNRPVGRGHTF